jgi:glycosyltransferase involved in cell wall biosynthesis
MDISVVVPTYRRPEKLQRCVESLLGQEMLPCEIIVSLRKGDYPTIELMQKMAASSALIKIAYVDVPGFIPPVNAGIRQARGDIVCFIDDDAVAPRDYLKKIRAHYDDPMVVGVGSLVLDRLDSRRHDRKSIRGGELSWFGKTRLFDAALITPRVATFVSGAAMSFSKSALREVDIRLNVGNASCYELDLSLHAQESKKGAMIIYDPDIHVEHFATITQVKSKVSRDNLYAYAHNLTYIILKYFPWWKKLAFLLYIYGIGQWNCPGIVTTVLSLFSRATRKKLGATFAASMRGRWEGIKDYFHYLQK